MSENTQSEKGLFETLEEKAPALEAQANTSIAAHENMGFCTDEFEFLVQDMFLDHFFP